jgi:PAS domain S-box-containing protein
VDTIQDGLMVVNRQGLIVSVNKALVEMTGYERTEKERVNEVLFPKDAAKNRQKNWGD